MYTFVQRSCEYVLITGVILSLNIHYMFQGCVIHQAADPMRENTKSPIVNLSHKL